MKTNIIIWIGVALLLLSACGNGKGDYDATGVFETTEVLVSAKGNGEIIAFDAREGQNVTPHM
ncbi:putative multidrug resistance protein EmrK, partial [termite gut metagenome]